MRPAPVTSERKRFSSSILPPWCRKSPKVGEVLPLLYLHGLSSGDFVPALGQFLGSSSGLSAPVITKLIRRWKAEQRAFAARDLSGVGYIYLWADGTHVNVRLGARWARCFRHRTKVTKGPGPRAAGLAMAFKLIESAQARWRAVNAPHLVVPVRAGAAFTNGQLVERPEGAAA